MKHNKIKQNIIKQNEKIKWNGEKNKMKYYQTKWKGMKWIKWNKKIKWNKMK